MNTSEICSPPHDLIVAVRIRLIKNGEIDNLDNVDIVSSNVHCFRKNALFFIFEDNEAVVKIIMIGRSCTMRHVSRTHRVALDWLFDRIKLGPKIQIKYIDTKNQLADILKIRKCHT